MIHEKIKHSKVKRIRPKRNSSKKIKLWKGGVKMNAIVEEKPVILAPMARMKQMAQEAMMKKGLTGKDVRKMIGIKRYEEEN